MFFGIREDHVGRPCFALRVVRTDPKTSFDLDSVFPDRTAGITAADSVTQPTTKSQHVIELLKFPAAEIVDAVAFELFFRRGPCLSKQLIERLLDSQFNRQLAEVVHFRQQNGMRNCDCVHLQPLCFAVQVYNADTFLVVNLFQKPSFALAQLSLFDGTDDGVHPRWIATPDPAR